MEIYNTAKQALAEQVREVKAKLKQLYEQRNLENLVGVPSEKDERLSPDYSSGTPLRRLILDRFDPASVKVLEIGSRFVASDRNKFDQLCEPSNYTGFDVHEGPNVDVVGDAHKLTTYFEEESFDIVFSAAVFEHLAMPWVVAEEISKILRPGGLVITRTHFSYSEHELPWHFFQFNKGALRVLFGQALGFVEIECHHALPMVGRFAHGCPEQNRGRAIGHLYCSTHHVAQKSEVNSAESHADFSWSNFVDLSYDDSAYPSADYFERRAKNP